MRHSTAHLVKDARVPSTGISHSERDESVLRVSYKRGCYILFNGNALALESLHNSYYHTSMGDGFSTPVLHNTLS